MAWLNRDKPSAHLKELTRETEAACCVGRVAVGYGIFVGRALGRWCDGACTQQLSAGAGEGLRGPKLPGLRMRLGLLLVAASAMFLTGCGEVYNNPHPSGTESTNTMFLPFTGRSPKYLDPASSYANELFLPNV